ncbi:MAG: HAD family hydrolase [Atopobiaceae bacterium]
MVRLILSDIDGTIMPHGNDEVDARTRQAFHDALDAGVHVGPCSGRGIDWVDPIFAHDQDCFKTAVATNGLQVRLDGQMIRQATLDHDALAQVADIVKDVPGAGLLCFVGGRPYLAQGQKADLQVAFPRYAESCVASGGVPDLVVGKANVFQSRGLQATTSLVGRLNREVEALDFDVALPTFSNIMPAGINKATGIDLLCQRIGCTLQDVVVFGDAGNDLSMLRHVPNSVAVANATDDAVAAARWHIGACKDDAVADAIEALAAGEWPFVC